jgi:Spy/CpxP family protein refolding chaperone
MRAMRFLTAMMLVLVATTAQAQGGQGGGGMGQGQGAGRMNEMLFKDITLTDAQKVKVDSIQAAGRESMRAMMQAGGMQDPANREKMMEMRAKQNADIRAVLTTEQQVVFDKNLAAMPAPGAGRRPPTEI